MESRTGAWQHNIVVAPTTTLLSFSAVYRCITGIATDVAKLRVKLVEQTDEKIWSEVDKGSPWLPVLRKPNTYQSRIDFFESWMLSKLLFGNAYILKQRNDRRGIVTGMHVLHPQCVKPLIAEDGGVYYEIKKDDLAQTSQIAEYIEDRIVIPSSEIIHDRINPLWHPLVGVSPLYACSMSGTMGDSIQKNSSFFFQNRAIPGGVLEAPGEISDATALRLKTYWDTNFGGANAGKIAVLGDGLKYSPTMMTAEQAQQTEQLKFAVEDVARAFGYPIWKLSGSPPPYTKPDQGQVLYYSDCLQIHLEKIEVCLDEGLELPADVGTEFDTDNLFRMDRQSQYEAINEMSDWATPDEQRFKANYGKLPVGGNTVYRQEQDHAIEALYKRDQSDDPFGKAAPKAPEPTESDEPDEESLPEAARSFDEDELELLYAAELRRELTTA